MAQEPIKRYCCVCGARLDSNLTAYELVQIGAGTYMGDGAIIFHCIGRHPPERIVDAAKFAPGFHRASEIGR